MVGPGSCQPRVQAVEPALAVLPVHIAGDRRLTVPLNRNLLVEYQGSKVLFRAVTEWLSFFRGIDTGETNLVLLAICIKHGNRIAIGNPDHATGKRFGLNRAPQK